MGRVMKKLTWKDNLLAILVALPLLLAGYAFSQQGPTQNSPGGGAPSVVNTTVQLQAGSVIGQTSQYPAGAIPITATNTGTTAVTTATLAANVTKTTFLCGFTIQADATAAIAGAATVTGTISGALNFLQSVGAATVAGSLSQTFSPCIPGSAINTGIAINSAAAGVGGVTAVSAWGYQL
jgi:hypothetical protein